MFEEQLKELGLTDNEVRIYLVLLEHGMMGPTEISSKLGLHRGYVYDALERMQDKEVVSYVLQNSKKYFQAISPNNLVELLRFRLESFENVVPSLINIMNKTKEETKVDVHKGKKVHRILIKDIISSMKKNDEFCCVGLDENILIKEDPIYFKQFLNLLKSMNIKEKIIIKEGGKKMKNVNLEYRELDSEYIGKTAQLMYNGKLAIFISGMSHCLIIINNRSVAGIYKKWFDLLWKSGR
ncbi:MAG TPA: helix-turn-helix domain-containing protein [Candidatus Nanoarchaeia archaeon]|nr:helix-turn-helix domain-containing protein [Candidatus Nanoarchaeia archaeon]